MITKEEVTQFLNWQVSPQSRVLSIYLNIEPSGEAALHRGHETIFKSLIRSVEKMNDLDRIDELKKDSERARRFILDYQPAGRGLVMFVDESRDFFWAKELKFHVANQAYWIEKPYILPLLEALDEYERYGVIVADKEKARVFSYALGEIEEEKDALAWNDVHHFRTTGKDNIRSAFKLQRTAQMHEQWHLKHVAELIEEAALQRPFKRLILGGSKQTVDELHRFLPLDFQAMVSGKLALSVDVPKKKLLQALTRLENQIEREEEIKLVEKLIRTAPENHELALGFEATLLHLDKSNIHTLIYSENFRPQGTQCSGCGYLFSDGRMMCGRCGSSIDSLPNFLEEMARRVFQSGGSIEEVRGQAARKLDEAGGVGAVLKWKERKFFKSDLKEKLAVL